MAKRDFTKEDKAEALVTVDACNGNLSKAAKLLGISRSTLRNWQEGKHTSEVTPELLEEKSSVLADRFKQIADKLTLSLLDEETIKKANLQQRATAAKIAIENMQLLQNRPTSITQRIGDDKKRVYEAAVKKLVSEAAKHQIEIDRDEAIDLLEIQLPDVKEVLGVQ